MKSSRFNTFFFSLFLSLLSFSPVYSQPDLATGSFTNFNGTAGEGGTFLTTYFSITNAGNAFADSSWVGFYISNDNVLSTDDLLLKELRVASLAVNESAYMGGNSLQLPSTLTSGNYWIIYVYDSRKNIAETNENNNVEAQKLAIQPPVFDFSLELRPDVIYNNFPIGLSQQILLRCVNNGNANAPIAPITVYLSSNQSFDANDTKLLEHLPKGSGIDKSSSISVSFPINIPSSTPEGAYFLIFIVDQQNQYTEGSEANNLLSRSVTLKQPKVDLRITGVSPWRDTLTTGIYRNFGFHFIDNKGNVTAKNVGYTIQLSRDTIPDASDIQVKTGSIDSLGVGDERIGFYFDGFIPSSVPAGDYYYLFFLDLKNGYPEANSKDNLFKLKLHIETEPISIPGYLVETGTLTQNDCFVYPIRVKSCEKKVVYTSSYAGTKYNQTCYFQDIIAVESEVAGQGLNIVFDKFNVSQDTLYVYDKTQLVGKFTGSVNPGPLYSKDGTFRIARMKKAYIPLPNSGYGFSISTVCGSPLDIQVKKKVKENDLVLFPNPSNSFVHLQLPEEKGTLEVMDTFGKTIALYEEAPERLETHLLPKGTYLIRWSSGQQSFSKLLVIR